MKGPSRVTAIHAPCLKTERRSLDHRDQTLSYLNQPFSGGRAPQAGNQEPVEPHAEDELCRDGRIGCRAGRKDDLLVPSGAPHAGPRGDRGTDPGIDEGLAGRDRPLHRGRPVSMDVHSRISGTVRQEEVVEEKTNRIGRGHAVARFKPLASHRRLASCRSGRRLPAASHRGLSEVNDHEALLEEVGGPAAAPAASATLILSLPTSRPTT